MRGLLANTIVISLSFFCFLVIASDYLLCATTDLSLYYIALALSAYSFSFYCCASGFCLSLYLVSSASSTVSNRKPAAISKAHDPVTSLSLINHRRACAARVTVLVSAALFSHLAQLRGKQEIRTSDFSVTWAAKIKRRFVC